MVTTLSYRQKHVLPQCVSQRTGASIVYVRLSSESEWPQGQATVHSSSASSAALLKLNGQGAYWLWAGKDMFACITSLVHGSTLISKMGRSARRGRTASRQIWGLRKALTIVHHDPCCT